MRRSTTVLVVAALAGSLWAVPVAAQPDGVAPTSWGAFAGRVVDWAAGLWRVVAGSESEPAPAEPVESEDPDGVALGGAGETSFGTTDPAAEKTPAIDPDG